MRKMIALAALALTTTAHAADKGGKPATLEQIMQPVRAASCYVETSVAGTFLKADREAIGGIGGGCDAKLANILVGGGIRADWGDVTRTGSIYARAGFYINNGATVYGLAEWKVPEWKPANASQLAIGLGSELRLDILNPNLSSFVEATTPIAKWGTATKEYIDVRLGLRYRF